MLMGRLLSLVILLLMAIPALATDHPFTCDGVDDNVALQTLYDSAPVVDGDTITIANGTCTSTSVGFFAGTSVSNAKSVTIQGSGSTIWQFNYTPSRVFELYCTTGKSIRLTNIEIDRLGGSQGSQSAGIIRLAGRNTSSTNCRVDHVTIRNVLRNAFHFDSSALVDHNVIYMEASGGTDNPFYFRNGEDSGNNKGWASGKRGPHYGTDDGVVLEDNLLWNCTPNVAEDACDSVAGFADTTNLTDGEFGSRINAWRYNVAHNFTTFVFHGYDGANMGHVKTESYRNTYHRYAGGAGGRVYHFRSGTHLVFEDSVVYHGAASASFSDAYTMYRAQASETAYDQSPTGSSAWSPGCIGYGPYDLNVGTGEIVSGTHTGGNSTPILEDTGKDFTSYSPTLLRSALVNNEPTSASYKKQGFIYAFDATTVYTIKDHAGGGTCGAGDGQPCFNTGDAYFIKIGRGICIGQAGWAPPDDDSAVLFSKPTNQPITPEGWPNWVRTPAYAWSNDIDGTVMPLLNDLSNPSDGGPAQAVDNHVPEGDTTWDPDFYNQADANNAHCTDDPFDGTCGVGVGVIASRPATCTLGVAYWATDEGEWDSTNGATADGRLYRCEYVNGPQYDRLNGSGATEWSLYYTPYDYPHPNATTPLAGPSIASITPDAGTRTEASVSVTIAGTGFSVAYMGGDAQLTISGTGVTASSVVIVSDISITADFAIDSAAATGIRNVTVTTDDGTSGVASFTVTAPVLTSISPTGGNQNTTVAVTIPGTTLGGASPGLTVSGTNVTVQNLSCSATQCTADLVIAAGATVGIRTVTFDSFDGTSGTVDFEVLASGSPTLDTMTPSSGYEGTVVQVTLTGSGLTGGTILLASLVPWGTASNVVVVSDSQITFDLTITNVYNDDDELLSPRNVQVTAGGDNSNKQFFTLLQAQRGGPRGRLLMKGGR